MCSKNVCKNKEISQLYLKGYPGFFLLPLIWGPSVFVSVWSAALSAVNLDLLTMHLFVSIAFHWSHGKGGWQLILKRHLKPAGPDSWVGCRNNRECILRKECLGEPAHLPLTRASHRLSICLCLHCGFGAVRMENVEAHSPLVRWELKKHGLQLQCRGCWGSSVTGPVPAPRYSLNI